MDVKKCPLIAEIDKLLPDILFGAYRYVDVYDLLIKCKQELNTRAAQGKGEKSLPAYFKLTNHTVDKRHELIGGSIVVDVDANNEIVGIEVLDSEFSHAPAPLATGEGKAEREALSCAGCTQNKACCNKCKRGKQVDFFTKC